MKILKRRNTVQFNNRIDDVHVFNPNFSSNVNPHVSHQLAESTHRYNRKRFKRNVNVKRLICTSWCGSSKSATEYPDVPSLAGRLLRAGSINDEEYADIVSADFAYRTSGESPQMYQLIPRERSRRSIEYASTTLQSNVKTRTPVVSCASGTLPPAFKLPGSSRIPEKEVKQRDPITLEDLGTWTWEFSYGEYFSPEKENEGCKSEKLRHCTLYNVDSLVQYLVHTGDFCEPITRIPFSYEQVVELENLASLAGVKTSRSLIEAWNASNASESYYTAEKNRREMLIGCDRCLGDIVSEMLAAVESKNAEQGQVQLLLLFPQFTYIFSELMVNDEDFARQCLSNYTQSLKGPPNNPTIDSAGLLPAALRFLSEVEHNLGDPCVTE